MASFRTFTFQDSEAPLLNTYSDWSREPSYDEVEILGSAKTDVTLLGANSRRLTFESRMTRSRFKTAEALIGTTGTLDDFEGDSNSAILLSLRVVGFIYAGDGTRYVRARWEFLEQ